MAGWRVGMLIGHQNRINEVLKFKSNMDSGMFLPIQYAAVKALSLGEDWYRTNNLIYEKRREKVWKLLDALNCNYSKNQVGLFVWAKIPQNYKDSAELSDQLLRQTKVFITPGSIFGSNGEKYVRVSLCNPVGILNEAINRIKKFITP